MYKELSYNIHEVEKMHTFTTHPRCINRNKMYFSVRKYMLTISLRYHRFSGVMRQRNRKVDKVNNNYKEHDASTQEYI